MQKLHNWIFFDASNSLQTNRQTCMKADIDDLYGLSSSPYYLCKTNDFLLTD